jgi:Ca-activated chloride channel homolog
MNTCRVTAGWIVTISLAGLATHALGGDFPAYPAIRADVNMVLVPVTVTDRRGFLVGGMTRHNFTILDDAVPQAIAAFYAQDAPCSVVIVLDTSGSMRETLEMAREATRAFVGTSNPDDEFRLLTVSSRPELHEAWSDAATMTNSLHLIQAGGSTALIDTVYLALSQASQARTQRRALLVLSDGVDNHSRYSKSELMRMAVESDVQIYTIGVAESQATMMFMEQREEQRGLSLLSELAQKTGGLSFVIRDTREAPTVACKVALAMRNQYVIGYQAPAAKQTGKWHRIRVTLDIQGAHVHARNGYYAR